MDVLVVAALLGLGAGGEQGPAGDLVALDEARRQRDSVDGAGLLVLGPGRAREVAAHDGLDGEDLELADDHAAVLDVVAAGLGHVSGHLERDEMGAQRGQGSGEELEPVDRQRGQDLPFIRDAL